MKIITISGQAGHGKDTSALFISGALEVVGNKSVLITHYADLLKYICKTYLKWDGNKNEQGRTLLQYVGTDVVRNRNPNYWVDFMTFVLDLSKDKWDYVIIPDVRFPNEIDGLKDKGLDVIHIRVIRPNFQNSLTNSQNSHISENAINNIMPDYTLINSGTLLEYRKNITEWVKENLI